MNFKISFKTWLKLSRKAIRLKEKAAGTENTTSVYDTEEDPKLIMVDIEVEQFFSTTSEEEIEPQTPFNLNKKKSMTGGCTSP